jgi:hypothetical protein
MKAAECPALAAASTAVEAAAGSMAAEAAATVVVAGATDNSQEVIRAMKKAMINVMPDFSRRIGSCMVPFAILALWTISSANAAQNQQSAQPTFGTTAEASQALFQAVQSNDESAIVKILGGQTELTTSHDPGQDKVDRELFVQKYQEMHRVGHEADGCMTLYIGAENWPFPVPLVGKNGAWRFDADAGVKEVSFRRIGDNELAAIAICQELVAAEKHRTSNSGDAADIVPPALIARVAGQSSGGDPILVHGYYFHVAATSPRFTVIAYPAEYRSSGVMTFLVTAKGRVYEKDLGADTTALTGAMAMIKKDSSWHVASK